MRSIFLFVSLLSVIVVGPRLLADEFACQDNIDNDSDTLVDFADPDCNCPPPDLNCTANDTSAAFYQATTLLDGCFGPGDTFTAVSLGAEIETNASIRYDIGLFIPISDPDDALATGCMREYLRPAANYPNSDGDLCGNVTSSTSETYVIPTAVTLPCSDSNGDGTVNIDTITSWGQAKNTIVCDGTDVLQDIDDFNGSKCKRSLVESNISVPDIQLSCTCTPSLISVLGQTASCSLTYNNTGVGAGQFWQLEVGDDASVAGIFTGVAYGGGSAGDQTLANTDESWKPGLSGVPGRIDSSETDTMTFDYQVNSTDASLSVTPVFYPTLPLVAPSVTSAQSSIACDLNIVPNYASVVNFTAIDSREGKWISWETVGEIGSLGFKVQAQQGGKWVPVHPGIVNAKGSEGGRYTVFDQSKHRSTQYRVVEVDAHGLIRELGRLDLNQPVRRTQVRPVPGRAGGLRAPRQKIGSKRATRAALPPELIGGDRQPLRERPPRPTPQLRPIGVVVPGPGPYELTLDELATALGESREAVGRKVRNGKFRLTLNGNDIPIDASKGTVRFLVRDSLPPYLDSWTLVAEWKSGVVMERDSSNSPLSAENDTYTHHQRFEKDSFATLWLASSPTDDFWYWKYVIAGGSDDRTTVSFLTPGVIAEKSARLSVKAYSPLANTGGTSFEIKVNGHRLGNAVSYESERFDTVLMVPARVLVDGTNNIEFRAEQGYAFIDSFDLTYQRPLQPVHGFLQMKNAPTRGLTKGWTSDAVTAYAWEDGVPRSLAIGLSSGLDGTVQAKYQLSSETEVWMVDTTGWKQVAGLRLLGKRNSLGRKPIDYLLITDPTLTVGAAELASYRESQGLRTRTVFFQDIVDQIGHGNYHPSMIKEYLTLLAERPRQAPRWVVLLGDGHWDFRDINGWGGNLIPANLMNVGNQVIASDSVLGDVDGSPGSEFLIGRIPANSREDVSNYVEKLKVFEASTADWKHNIAFVADNPDHAGDYHAAAFDLSARAPNDFNRNLLLLGRTGDPGEIHSELIDQINDGTLALVYSGHGGATQLAAESILSTADMDELTNSQSPGILFAFGCLVNITTWPGVQTLPESLLFDPDGGSVAAFGATAASRHAQSHLLATYTLPEAWNGDNATLGEAVFSGLRSFIAGGGSPDIAATYSLTGDPALRLTPPQP